MYKSIAIIVFYALFVVFGSTRALDSIPEWTDHDISTLKLLQIVHRHGERTVLKDNLPKTDPFTDLKEYWPEGWGQLTGAGKSRLYKMGQYLRQSYQSYLGDVHSPREVYVRSSIEPRCVESVSCLLSGMYPPKNEWIWDSGTDPLGQIWQPFPIETFMPKDEDTVLVPHKKCPKATEEHNKISASAKVRKIVDDFNKEDMSKYLKQLFNESITSLYRGQQFWDSLKIEAERGHIWPQLNGTGDYNQTQVIARLNEFAVGSYVEDWDTDFIRTIRLGKLIEILITNMKNKINEVDGDYNRKLYAYSTHDTIVCPLLQAFGIYNRLSPPYGSAVLIELHEIEAQPQEHLVKIYYYNETLTHEPYLLYNKSLETFESSNKKYYYTDFDQMCGIANKDDNHFLSDLTFLIIGVAIGVGLLGLNILAIRFIRNRRHSAFINK